MARNSKGNKMKLKITLSQRPSSEMIINGLVNIPVTESSDPIYSLTYNLTKNCSTTDKFIDLSRQTFQSGPFRCDYNLYKGFDIESHFGMKNKMNSIIETINAMNELPDIDTSLMLNVSISKAENSKLNALHLYFELTSKDILHLSEEAHLLLEEVNQLVHSLEGEGEEIKVSQNSRDTITYASLRLLPDSGNVITMPLTDEDYDNFTIHDSWGDLLLDFFTVGKDLYQAATTNDVSLIVNKELSQQLTVHPCVSLLFVAPQITEAEADKAYEWCDENNVKNYYDIDLPMFNFGRVILGKIDSTDTTKDEIITELAKCSTIINAELIDE